MGYWEIDKRKKRKKRRNFLFFFKIQSIFPCVFILFQQFLVDFSQFVYLYLVCFLYKCSQTHITTNVYKVLMKTSETFYIHQSFTSQSTLKKKNRCTADINVLWTIYHTLFVTKNRNFSLVLKITTTEFIYT